MEAAGSSGISPMYGESRYPPHVRPWPAGRPPMPQRPAGFASGPPPLPPRRTTRRKSPVVHVLLFLATLLTTTTAGALQQGASPLEDPASLTAGLPFSLTLLLILFCHEMGHYLCARWHGIETTLPYFIPGPPILIGTFGAFIRMQGMPRNRAALFDVGAAGPWAGMFVALPAVAIGLAWSEVHPLELGAGAPFSFGSSMLFDGLGKLILGVDPEKVTILLHPVAIAGWFGFFVTFLNLLPVGQLDGGHVSYALLGKRHRMVSRGFLVLLLVLWALPGGWDGWLLWAFLLFFVLRADHPDTADRDTPLDPRRRAAAWATAAVFFATFMPVPFEVNETPRVEERPGIERREIPPRRDRRHEGLLEARLPMDLRPAKALSMLS